MRLMLSAAAAFLLIAAAPPPPAPVEPVTDDYYGTRVTDDYRWMESGKDPRWMPWLKAQASHARARFDALPGRAELLADINARSGGLGSVGQIIAAGRVMVYRERAVGGEDFMLMVRDVHEAPRVLLDPDKALPGQSMVLDGYSLSPDGKTVAVRMSKRGTERSSLFLIDIGSGRLTPELAGDVGGVSWLPDSGGIAYAKFVGEHGKPSYYVNNEVRLRRLDAKADVAIPVRNVAGVSATPNQRIFVLTTANSGTALLLVRDGRSEFAAYRTDISALTAGKAAWRRLIDFDDKIVDASWSGDDLYLTSRKSSSNGELLHLRAASGTLGEAKVIAIPGSPVIESITATRGGLLVVTLEGGSSGLWFAPASGTPRRIGLPFAGTIGWLSNDRSNDEALLAIDGRLAPSKQFHLAENGDLHDITMTAPPPFDLSGYEAIAGTATARDGTAIPYTMLRRRDRKAGPAPTLLEAYGSYGISITPFFQTSLLPFLDRGGTYVMANVRGGGEFGRAWHFAGKAETKANSWGDAIAVAEKLIADGETSTPKLTLLGTSAGGVMVGGAVNARPDLFGAAIANVGFMNPIRYVSEQNYGDIEEWGGPIADAQSFRTMFNLDPYANIRKGTAYPATLVVSGINDPRAATFHSAKYAARLAASSSSGKPVLLRIDFDAGHGIGSSRSQLDSQWADMLSFVLWQAGVPEFQPN